MDLGIKNKRALVLASSQGLRLGIATQLCKEGANVLLIGRDETKLAAAAKTLTDAATGSAAYAVVDLSAADAAARLYAAAQDKLGGVDILVNNTGDPPPRYGGREAASYMTGGLIRCDGGSIRGI